MNIVRFGLIEKKTISVSTDVFKYFQNIYFATVLREVNLSSIFITFSLTFKGFFQQNLLVLHI